MTEILFEFRQIGNSVKVTAIDPKTGTEVSIVGSASMTQYSLQQAAKRKLERVIGQKNN